MAQISVTLPPAQSLHTFRIPLHLTIHAEARRNDEVWSGKANPATRRKLQNRLNQRSHRRRKAEEKASKVQVFEIVPPSQPDAQEPPPLPDAPNLPVVRTTSIITSTSKIASRTASIPSTATVSWCRRLEPVLLYNGLTQPCRDTEATKTFEESFLPYLDPTSLYRLPGDDHLLSLMYYNVFRALVANVQLLGLETKLMHMEEYPSPFVPNPVNYRYRSANDLTKIPPHLRPTQMQLTVPHHPCFDIFPCPAVRDNAILGVSMLPHGTLCMTLAGRNTWNENERDRRNGFVVWGAPEDADSWEVTPGFLRNWRYLVRGSKMLEDSTNRWRRKRGESEILFA